MQEVLQIVLIKKGYLYQLFSLRKDICTKCSHKEKVFLMWQYVAASSGIGEGDLSKLKYILEAVPEVMYICIDVANGYSEHFVQFVRDARKMFPSHTILVSYVAFG